MRVRNRKQTVTFVVLFALLSALFWVALPRAAINIRADEENTGILYRYFDDASAIAANGNKVYIADEKAVHIYSPAERKFDGSNLPIGGVSSMAANPVAGTPAWVKATASHAPM